jgi:N-acetylmuramoyl-L-alanine amidase
MTLYHAFNEIDPNTPAAIIETGFLNLDYDILTKDTATVANGVANGVICFLQNENIPSTETP